MQKYNEQKIFFFGAVLSLNSWVGTIKDPFKFYQRSAPDFCWH